MHVYIHPNEHKKATSYAHILLTYVCVIYMHIHVYAYITGNPNPRITNGCMTLCYFFKYIVHTYSCVSMHASTYTHIFKFKYTITNGCMCFFFKYMYIHTLPTFSLITFSYIDGHILSLLPPHT